jgi:protein phosphatase
MDVVERTFAPGDLLLLCSDGLHGALDDKALEAVLASGKDVELMAEELVRQALERDGNDNITALVVRLDMRASV